MTKDRFSGIIVLIFGIIWLLLTTQVKGNAFSTAIGPELFPYIASGGLILCGFGLIFRKPRGEEKPFFTKEGWKRVLKLSIALVAFPFFLEFLGFFIASFYLVFITLTLFDLEKALKFVKRVIFAASVTALVFLFFNNILNLPLPDGKLISLIIG